MMMDGVIFVLLLLAFATFAEGQVPAPIEEAPFSDWEPYISEWETLLEPKPEFAINTAWLNVHSEIITRVTLYGQNEQCHGCDLQKWTDIPVNGTTTLIQTAFGNYLDIRNTAGGVICSDYVSSWRERGDYWLIVSLDPDTSGSVCNVILANDPDNYNLPILWAFLVSIGLCILWVVGKIIYRKYRNRSKQTHEITSSTMQLPMTVTTSVNDVNDKTTSDNDVNEKAETVKPKPPPSGGEKKKKARVRSLDTFRGISLIVMIFVNYGGGGYYFFEHAHWDGLHVADLVFPWFVWIMGVSVEFALRGQIRRGKPKWKIFLKILERTVKLFFIGICLGAPNSADMKNLRIPGVLQRLALTYFFTALVHLAFVDAGISNKPSKRIACCGCCVGALRDIVLYWPEWIIMLAILALQLCLTYLLPVPGCPTGYVGPGGLHMGGSNFNCTGGAALYIDVVVLSENHIYQNPTIKGLYGTSMPYDPEGILGTLTSIFMCFLGLQAGKIIAIYKDHTGRIVRWLFWGILTGAIGTILCKASQFDGWVPLNKNLWSVSFILALSGMAFILLVLLYLIIDVAAVWNGSPFIYPGMNSIVIYICQAVFMFYFPVSWEWPDYTLHWQRLFRGLWGCVVWTFVAYVMYIKKTFIAL